MGQLYSVLVIIVIILAHMPVAVRGVHAQDAVPVTCPYRDAAYYRANLFPRYEPQNSRLLLVDWTTGAEEQVLGTDLDWTVALDWSLDCRYLVVAVGPSSSIDTVVFDTTSGERIGSVPDAHRQPHHLTWGPGDYLVVETRGGAVLWNVPANSQIMLTTLFNTTTARNFSRIRWDPEHNQILVNFAVGGRAAYDLASGQEVPAANITDAVPGSGTGTSVVGGRVYQCQEGYSYGWHYGAYDSGYVVPGIYATYDITDGLIVLVLGDYGQPRSYYHSEVIQTVEDDVDASWFRFRGWSANCRYFAGSLGIPGTNDSETVVWDVRTNRRVFTLTAHDIMHPFAWDPSGDVILVQTRDGAQLWHLPTATRTILHSNVTMSPDGATIQNFHSFQWDARRSQLLAVPVGASNTVVAYDTITGQQTGVYPSGGTHTPVSFLLSPDGGLMAVYHPQDTGLTAYSRDAGGSVRLNLGAEASDLRGSGFAISPDNRFVAVDHVSQLLVWDLQALNAGATPNHVYESPLRTRTMVFVDNVTLQYGLTNLRVNVATGEEYSYVDRQTPASAPLPGQTGWSDNGARSYYYYYYGERGCNGLIPVYDREARQLLIADAKTRQPLGVLEADLNQTSQLHTSPDCAIVIGLVSVISNDSVPYDNAPFDDHIRDRATQTLVFWDAQTGQRLREFPNPDSRYTGARLDWSSDSAWAFVKTTEGYFLWQRAGDRVVVLSYMPFVGGNTYVHAINTEYSVYWDFERGQVLASGWNAVHAFDIRTGVERTVFPAECFYWGCSFKVLEDNKTLIVTDKGSGYSVSRWNLDTLACTPGRAPWASCDPLVVRPY